MHIYFDRFVFGIVKASEDIWGGEEEFVFERRKNPEVEAAAVVEEEVAVEEQPAEVTVAEEIVEEEVVATEEAAVEESVPEPEANEPETVAEFTWGDEEEPIRRKAESAPVEESIEDEQPTPENPVNISPADEVTNEEEEVTTSVAQTHEEEEEDEEEEEEEEE